MTAAELVAAFGEYQTMRGFSPNTVQRRRLSLGRFLAFVSPGDFTTATTADVEEWLRRLRSPRTRHAYRSDLGSFFRWALRRGLVASDPTVGVDSVKVPKALPKPAPRESIAAALATAPGDIQLAVMLGALAGLRRAEIAALDAADVHLEAVPPVIHVRNGKGGKDRIVPIHPQLVPMLAGRTGWLFPSPSGAGHLHADHLGRRMTAALSAAGQRVTPHQLRHFFGTEAARAAAGNILLVASLMGHESPDTTRGYIAWSPTAGAEVVAAITGTDELAARRGRRTA